MQLELSGTELKYINNWKKCFELKKSLNSEYYNAIFEAFTTCGVNSLIFWRKLKYKLYLNKLYIQKITKPTRIESSFMSWMLCLFRVWFEMLARFWAVLHNFFEWLRKSIEALSYFCDEFAKYYININIILKPEEFNIMNILF